MPNISNSNKSVICQARSLKFYMIVDLDNTKKLYHAISYHTTIYQVIPNTKNFTSHNSVLFQTRCPKFSVLVDSNRPYHTILYHTLKYQIIPNTKYFTYQWPNNLNSHNSVSFKASSPKFCMVIYLYNT